MDRTEDLGLRFWVLTRVERNKTVELQFQSEFQENFVSPRIQTVAKPAMIKDVRIRVRDRVRTRVRI